MASNQQHFLDRRGSILATTYIFLIFYLMSLAHKKNLLKQSPGVRKIDGACSWLQMSNEFRMDFWNYICHWNEKQAPKQPLMHQRVPMHTKLLRKNIHSFGSLWSYSWAERRPSHCFNVQHLNMDPIVLGRINVGGALMKLTAFSTFLYFSFKWKVHSVSQSVRCFRLTLKAEICSL